VTESESTELHPGVWAEMASARRTIEWTAVERKRIESARYTGAGLLRLFGRISVIEGVDPQSIEMAQKLAGWWEGFDGGSVDERVRIIEESRSILDALVPMGELGARRQDLSRRARLSKPSRRDRRPPKPAEDSATEVKAAPDSQSKPDSVGGDDSEPESLLDGDAAETIGAETDAVAPMDGAESTQAETVEPAVSEEEAAEPDIYAWLNLPATWPKVSPRPPRRLDWNHVEGTGMPLSQLGVLDEAGLKILEERGMITIDDFLSHPPASHTRVTQAQFAEPGGADEVDAAATDLGTEDEPVMVRGRLNSRLIRVTGDVARYEVTLDVRHAGEVRCIWVGQRPRGWVQWRSGMELAFVGSLTEGDDGWALFEGEPVGVDGRGSGWVPSYNIEGIPDAMLRNLAARALFQIMDRIREPLPQKLVDSHRLMELDEALRDAHFPSNKAGRGRSRLAFEELLLLQAGIGWRARTRSRARGISHKVLHSTVGQLSLQQQVQLSDSAEAVFSEVRRDLRSSHAMVRLLQGEVGTDKTTIAMLTAAVVIENKAQVLYILPDAESAERRFLFIDGMFRAVGHVPAFVPSAPDRGQLDAIARGECNIVFGTTALLDASVKWKKLGLVVVEERNEYGTVDPARLVESGPSPDLLVITDTPIPSSLTLTVFGEYQMSTVLNDYPVRCKGDIFEQSDRLDAYAQVREAVEEGRQAYVVFPVGADGDLLGPEQALQYATGLQAEALEGVRIGVYCSAMSREDRVRVFEDFQHRRLDVLVATTHIEEAPHVSNAVVVVVEHADHHELARLHRLRGHVGQGAEPGRCLLVMSESPSEDAKRRLSQLVAENDGYKIAEMDLKERGWKALLGQGAEEAPVFRWADPVLDHQQLLSARDEAFRIVKADPGMRRYRTMVAAVGSRWGEWLGVDFSAIPPDKQGEGSQGGNKRKGRRRRRRGR
jgi:ATP-dependent DNA helicase RecG